MGIWLRSGPAPHHSSRCVGDPQHVNVCICWFYIECLWPGVCQEGGREHLGLWAVEYVALMPRTLWKEGILSVSGWGWGTAPQWWQLCGWAGCGSSRPCPWAALVGPLCFLGGSPWPWGACAWGRMERMWQMKVCCGGEFSACGVSAPVPCSVGFWGAWLCCSTACASLGASENRPSSGRAAGGCSGCVGAAAGLSSHPLCLRVPTYPLTWRSGLPEGP